jgi:hypothetical protein
MSGTGRASQSIPLALPPARGGIPVPLSIVYDGGTRLGELGVGWSIPFSYVEKPTTLAHTRPIYSSDPNAAPVPLDRVYLVLGGSRTLMVPVGGGRYRPMVGGQGMELSDLGGDQGWRLNDGSGRVFRFEMIDSLADDGFWPLEEINDPTGLNPVKLIYDVQLVDVGGVQATELSLVALEYNQQPGGGCAKHRIEIDYGSAHAIPLSVAVANKRIHARNRVVEAVNILANGETCGARQRLAGYRFAYIADTDTGLPRLNSVDIVGRAGTAEETARIPVARYA